MKAVFYKNWKKLALVITSVFWASCGDDSVPLYGAIEVHNSTSVDSSSSEPAPSFEEKSSSSEVSKPDKENKSSSSVAPALSSDTPASSASEPESSSDSPASSASEPATSSEEGDKIACVETTFEKKYADWSYQTHGVKCEDGEEYALESICPDYGINLPCSNTYINENGGRNYNEEDFKKIYKVAKSTPKSSSSTEPASSNSSEKIACAKTTLERYEGLPCDGDICPVYGVMFTEVEGLKCEDGVEYEIQSVCAKYGVDIPCKNEYIGNNGKIYNEEEFKKIYEIDSKQ